MNSFRFSLDHLHTVYHEQNSALRGIGFAGRQLMDTAAERSNRTGGFGDVLNNDAPWNEQPFNSIPFFPKNSILIPAVGAGDVVVTQIEVPDGHDGVIKQLSCNFSGGSFDPGSGDIVWRILRNNVPVRNFDNMVAEYGTIDQPVEVSGIRVAGGDTVQFVVNHVANNLLNGNIICSFEGYFYPKVGTYVP